MRFRKRRGDLTRFLDSPVCVVALVLTVFVLWLGLRRMRRREAGVAVGSDTD